MKLLLGLLIALSTITAQAEDDYKEMWFKTGYNLTKLFNEHDFNPANCMSSERIFAACLMALDEIVKGVEGSKKGIISREGKPAIGEVEDVEPAKTGEEFLKRLQEQRDQYFSLQKTSTQTDIEALFAGVSSFVNANGNRKQSSMLAGEGYATFLKEAYDPHSNFVPEESFYPKPDEYFGMGAEVTVYSSEDKKLDGAIAVSPMPGSPAEAAGLKKGDLILEIDGEPTQSMTFIGGVDKIKGPAGTQVQFKVHRLCSNQEEMISVTRGPITHMSHWLTEARFVSLQKSDEKKDICGEDSSQPVEGRAQALYVPLTSFHESPDMDLCMDFVNYLQPMDLGNPDSLGIILDLRGNGGGSVDAVTCMLNSIISSDVPMLGQIPVQRGRVLTGYLPAYGHYFTKEGDLFDESRGEEVFVTYNRNIIVLVDENSASASEIFAGTIQDMKRGWVVGDRTFGKGSVQSYYGHDHGGDGLWGYVTSLGKTNILKGMTTAIYTLPSGRSPQQFGIIPDIMVDQRGELIPLTEDYVTTEAKMYGSIGFENNQWEQNRGDELAELKGCVFGGTTLGATFKNNIKGDSRYARPFVANYQLDVAKDLLRCAPRRADFIDNSTDAQ